MQGRSLLWNANVKGLQMDMRQTRTDAMSGPGRNYEHLHQLYRELTGRDEAFIPFATEHEWAEWVKLWKHREPWTPENGLRLVIAYRLNEIRHGRRYPASLAFRNMIRDIAQADDLIADALAARRKAQAPKMPEGKADVMRATGRPTELPQSEAKPVGEVVERLKLSQQLKAWKEANL